MPHIRQKLFEIVFIISESGRGTRNTWNNGFFSWSHIACLYYENLESGLKLVNKLTSDHINLTSYAVMRVNLAAQVLSETAVNVLNNFGPEEAVGTRQFLITGDNFFDCLNVRNTKKHIIKSKLFLKPNESIGDIRFAWLDGFLQCFKSWKGYNEA